MDDDPLFDPKPAAEATWKYVLAGLAIILGTLVCGMLATSVAGGRFAAPVIFPSNPTASVQSAGRIEVPADLAPGRVVTIRGSGFTPGERVEVFFARTENDRPEAWIKLAEALGTDRVGENGVLELKNVVVPNGVGIPGVLFGREARTQALTVAVSLLDGRAVNGGSLPVAAQPAAPTSTPLRALPTTTPFPPLAFPTYPPLATPAPVTALPLPTLVPPPSLPPLEATPTADSVSGDVWETSYFNNRFLAGSPTLRRGEPTINLNWGRGSPAAEVPADNFSAMFQKWVNFETSDNYLFALSMDDGARFYIDNELVIGNQWYEGGYRVVEANRFVRRGQHRLRVDYFEASGYAAVGLAWQPHYLDWQGTYYNSPNLEGEPAYQRDDAAINFDWGFGAPAPGVSADQFSVSWKRVITFPTTGSWVFTATMDDGMRVYVDSALVINSYDARGLRTLASVLNLNAGTHRLEVQYVERTGAAVAKLNWAPYVPPPPATATAVPPTPTNIPVVVITVIVVYSPTPVPPTATPAPIPPTPTRTPTSIATTTH